jgi:hypothetical protein
MITLVIPGTIRHQQPGSINAFAAKMQRERKETAKAERASHLTPSRFTEYLGQFRREDVQEQAISLVKTAGKV